MPAGVTHEDQGISMLYNTDLFAYIQIKPIKF